MIEELALYLSFGCLAGLLSGLFGIGGGVVIVPFLLWLFPDRGFSSEWVMLMAVATSLATIMVTSLSASLAHHRRGAVDWRTVTRLSPGILLGAMAGSVIARYLPTAWFKLIFVGFLFYVAIRLLSTRKTIEKTTGSIQMKERPLLFASAGLGIGALSSILGIGGGTLSVPFLLRQHYPVHSAVAISSACGFPIALAGTASYILLGFSNTSLPAWSLGFIYLPAFACIALTSVVFAPLGVQLAHRWSSSRLRALLALAMIAIGGKLLWQILP